MTRIRSARHPVETSHREATKDLNTLSLKFSGA
jgi:hypothetical protein